MNAALRTTLSQVAAAMRPARRPWWIIGSAAVVLLDGQAQPGDVDVLLSPDDAAAVLGPLGLACGPGVPGDGFASDVFARWTAPPLPVEFMAGLRFAHAPVAPVTRVAHDCGETVFTPDRAELTAILHRFGRTKDRLRAATLIEDN